MARFVGAAAERVFVSIPEWRAQLRGLVRRDAMVKWLPVPSSIDVVNVKVSFTPSPANV